MDLAPKPFHHIPQPNQSPRSPFSPGVVGAMTRDDVGSSKGNSSFFFEGQIRPPARPGPAFISSLRPSPSCAAAPKLGKGLGGMPPIGH